MEHQPGCIHHPDSAARREELDREFYRLNWEVPDSELSDEARDKVTHERHACTCGAEPVRSLYDILNASQTEDAAEKEAWALGDYTDDDCPNCGRTRLCKCPNGKTRCEKCNWVVEDKAYAPVPNL